MKERIHERCIVEYALVKHGYDVIQLSLTWLIKLIILYMTNEI